MSPRKIPIISPWHLLGILLLLVHLLPIWIVTYFPTQDGPSHIYNAQVFKEYHDHQNYRIRDVYQLNLTPFPNWASHLLLAFLMYFFPPLICEKIVLSLCVLGLPLSLIYFLWIVNKEKLILGLVGFIYSYHYLLMMGFYNFSLSVPVFFCALGYWWQYKHQITVKRLGVFYLWLVLAYFSHFQSFFLLVISVSVFGFLTVILFEPNNGESTPVNIRLRKFLYFVGYMMPAYATALFYFLSKTQGYSRSYRELSWLNEYLLNMKSLVYFRDDHQWIGRILLALLSLLLLVTLWRRIKSILAKRQVAPISGVRWVSCMEIQDLFLIMSLILTFIYYASPNHIQSGGGWINDRVHIYLVLMLLPFLTVSFHLYLRYALATILVGLSLWHLAYTLHDNYFLDKEIAEMTASINQIEENSTLVLYLDKPGQKYSQALGPIKYVHPYLHVGSYYCLNNRVALLRNYEATYDYFPVNYRYQMEDRPYSGPKTAYPESADYVLAWRMTATGTEELQRETLGQDYQRIHTAEGYTLYWKDRPPPDPDWWPEQKDVTFDFQPTDGETAADHIPVSPTIRYENQYGWVTRAKLTGGVCSGQTDTIPQDLVSRDMVIGSAQEDGVFRIALPNGRYRVECIFRVNDQNTVSLIANGKKVVQKLKGFNGSGTVEQTYTVTIENQQLTQIAYTTGHRWKWSGCRIWLLELLESGSVE